MKFSRNIKILLGLATGFYAVAPILLVGFYFLWMFSMIPIFSTMEQANFDFPVIPFLLVFFAFFGVIMLFNLLHFVLIPIYLALLIKNKDGLDVLRIIIATGCIFLPFIALPAYFLIFILPSAVPGWAMEPNHKIHNAALASAS